MPESNKNLMNLFTEELEPKRLKRTNDIFFEVLKDVYSEKKCNEYLNDFIDKCEMAIKNATMLKEDLLARKESK